MEKETVLAKFFDVAEKLKTDQANYRKQAPAQSRFHGERISHSACEILRILDLQEPVNQRALAKQMLISAQAVSENIRKLEQLGYITKQESSCNNENLIARTPAGVELTAHLEQRIKSHAKEVFTALQEEEIETLYTLLEKLL